MVAVLVSFGGTVVLIVQAGQAAGLEAALIGSWLGLISLDLGMGGAVISLRLGLPVALAWSTPSTAFLVTTLVGVPFDQAVGAFIVAAALILACGLFGWIDPIVKCIPSEIAAAMLAGVLLNFDIGIFSTMSQQPGLVLALCVIYLVAKRWIPRYAIVAVMVGGIAIRRSKHCAVIRWLFWIRLQRITSYWIVGYPIIARMCRGFRKMAFCSTPPRGRPFVSDIHRELDQPDLL